jgi:integrase
LKAGPRWSNEHDLVFTTAAGRPLDPRNVLRTFYALRKQRRSSRGGGSMTCATAPPQSSIAQGVELIEVSMLLGHSETRTTGDLYGHLVKQTAAKAASHMDAVLKPAAKA